MDLFLVKAVSTMIAIQPLQPMMHHKTVTRSHPAHYTDILLTHGIVAPAMLVSLLIVRSFGVAQ